MGKKRIDIQGCTKRNLTTLGLLCRGCDYYYIRDENGEKKNPDVLQPDLVTKLIDSNCARLKTDRRVSSRTSNDPPAIGGHYHTLAGTPPRQRYLRGKRIF